jgi:clan AA aspartic protease (TIGR02281 family)
MKWLFSFVFSLIVFYVSAQDIIQMEKSGGVYKVPCKINGLGLKFIFDTGASDVSISLSEAVFMVKNGYLNESDFRGTETYRIANGDIAEGTKVILRKVEFGKQTLYNVEASIVHSMDAPLLLGQSVLKRLGKFSVDYSKNALIIGSSEGLANSNKILPNNTVTDIDGIDYPTVKIGKQIWTARNLNVATFRNGDAIHHAQDDDEWRTLNNIGKPAWCYFLNDESNGVKYGKLYNWYAVSDGRGLCPTGWHVPTDEEWTTLTDFLGGRTLAGIKMKDNSGWKYSNGVNSHGFTGMPGGCRWIDGHFFNIERGAYWWSSSEGYSAQALYIYLNCTYDGVFCYENNNENGFSVRCIKD